MTPSNTAGDRHRDTNWAATPDSKEFGTVLAGKLQDFASVGSSTGVLGLHSTNVSIAYSHLYGFDVEGVGANAALVTRSGEQGSVAELRIPGAAALLTKTWNLVVGPELAWTTLATNTDFANEARALTARNAIQYYWSDKGVSVRAKAVAFEALAFGEAAIHIPWDPEAGEVVGVEPGVDLQGKPIERLIRNGDIAYRMVSTWDLIRDPTAKSWESMNWVIVREWHNRYDLAAGCEDQDVAQACLQASSQVPNYWRPPMSRLGVESDLIPVYFFYHRQTLSVPTGRQTVFLDGGEVLEDAELDRAYWRHLPVVRLSAGEYSGTPWPYTKYFAILGAQQASDGLYRDLLTNATATSGGLISAVEDSDLPPMQLGGGPKIIYRRKDDPKPEPLVLQQSHPEHFNLVNRLRNEAQQIMGLDNLTAGQEIGANLSGAAMALLTSTSVQNNSQLQAAWADFVQRLGTVTLSHIEHHMKVPRRVVLAGKARAGLVASTELSGAAIQGVDRVQVTLGSALQQTDAGKYEIATTALKQGWAQTPQQFQTVLDTGRLDAMTQDLSNELLLIAQENEALSSGEDVPVMLDDDQVLHLKMHRAVTASITARRDPRVVEALQRHQDEHIRMLRETDPRVLQLFGQPSMAAPMGPGPGGAANDNAETKPPVPPPAQEQAQEQAPSMPTNPVTKQKAGPVAGTVPPALAIRRTGSN